MVMWMEWSWTINEVNDLAIPLGYRHLSLFFLHTRSLTRPSGHKRWAQRDKYNIWGHGSLRSPFAPEGRDIWLATLASYDCLYCIISRMYNGDGKYSEWKYDVTGNQREYGTEDVIDVTADMDNGYFTFKLRRMILLMWWSIWDLRSFMRSSSSTKCIHVWLYVSLYVFSVPLSLFTFFHNS